MNLPYIFSFSFCASISLGLALNIGRNDESDRQQFLYSRQIVDELDYRPEVQIEGGKIRGRIGLTVGENKWYYAFQGIPYAEPPVGKLRFKAPVKKTKWAGVLDTFEDESKCVQDVPASGSEDCLYLNVYTPSLKKKGLSVIAWIHGGGFIEGNTTNYILGPDYFLDQDVIFVSLNYRLGVFGFLSTEDLACPGNWGLKDQVLALKWIQENIAKFGGNPKNVVLMGQSAGSASISYLMQTNKTAGLFSAAVMESGTSLNLWALNRKANATAFTIGAMLGINATSSTELVEELSKVDYRILQHNAFVGGGLVMMTNALEGLLFAPVIEPVHEDALFVNKSDQLLRDGGFHRVPVLMGFTSNEAAAVEDIPGILKVYLVTYDFSKPSLAPADLTSNNTVKLEVGEMIVNFYCENSFIANETDEVIAKLVSDDQFVRPVREAAMQMSKYTDVYYYRFAYEGQLGRVLNRTVPGVVHAEELNYLFRREQTPTADDIVTRSRLIKLWTNFAKYHNPTPTKDELFSNILWPKVDPSSADLLYFDINKTLSLKYNPNEEGMRFYDSIFDKYGEPPYSTY